MDDIGGYIFGGLCLFLFAALFFLIGATMGISSMESPSVVCKSVNLEWVEDQKKCMKVTREAV